MAIGSAPEIGVTFRQHDGSSAIDYPWIVDDVVHQLMHGEARLGFVPGREGNVLPADGEFYWCGQRRNRSLDA